MPENPLLSALKEIERYVGHAGWDQPARLFALVPTDELVRAEPGLAAQLNVASGDRLSSIEQDDFHAGTDLFATLSRLSWPAGVKGCALVCERSFRPSWVRETVPTDATAAMDFVADHPDREDIRIVVGVMRDGSQQAVARLRSHPDDLLSGAELVPDLAHALFHTLI